MSLRIEKVNTLPDATYKVMDGPIWLATFAYLDDAQEWAKKKTCENCKGDGQYDVDVSSTVAAGRLSTLEEPIYERKWCPDCEGTGIVAL